MNPTILGLWAQGFLIRFLHYAFQVCRSPVSIIRLVVPTPLESIKASGLSLCLSGSNVRPIGLTSLRPPGFRASESREFRVSWTLNPENAIPLQNLKTEALQEPTKKPWALNFLHEALNPKP